MMNSGQYGSQSCAQSGARITASGAEWSFMGVGKRRAMARAAREVSAVPDMSPAISAMGENRETGRGAACSGAPFAGTRTVEVGRSVRRCHLRERKKGGLAIGPTRRGKGTKIIAIATGNSLPLAVAMDSASPAECQLVESVLAGSFLNELPEHLIGDKACDSNKLDKQLQEEYGIEMIAPNRRKRSKT
jgi:hypothetical protein